MSGELRRTFYGHIATQDDALLLFEACLSGVLDHIPRRPSRKEQASLAKSGNVFIYEEHSSGVKQWNDGGRWSISDPYSKRGTDGEGNGIFRKTITVTLGGVKHYLVAYYSEADVSSGNLSTPSQDRRFQHLTPRPTIFHHSTSVVWRREEQERRAENGYSLL